MSHGADWKRARAGRALGAGRARGAGRAGGQEGAVPGVTEAWGCVAGTKAAAWTSGAGRGRPGFVLRGGTGLAEPVEEVWARGVAEPGAERGPEPSWVL